MSAERRPEARPARRSTAIRAEKVVCCPIDDTLLLAIGTGRSMARQLAVELNDDPNTEAKATVVSWPLSTPAGSDTHGFAALVPLGTPRRHLPSTLRVHGGAQDRRYMVAPRPASIETTAAIVAELAGSHFPETAGNLADALMEGSLDRRKLSAITAFLRAGSQTDGCVELLGETHDGEIFIQGWWRTPLPGIRRVFVIAETPSAGECAVAMYSRDNIPKGASGFVGLLRAGETLKAGSIEALLLQQQGGWCYVPVHDSRTIAGALETPGCVRSVVLSTRGSSEILVRLRAAANRFDGSETISGLPLPVRMGIDSVFDVDGGFLISGWLLDPDRHVAEARLRGNDTDARLDDRWTRYDRSDVTNSFTGHPDFGTAIDRTNHAHGFVVFTEKSEGAPSMPLHVELTLHDTRRAFMPLTATRIASRAAAMRQVRAIDAADWALPEIIDRQIIPFLTTCEKTPPEAAAVTDFGPFEEASGPAIIVGLGENEEQDVAPLLALLALDPETRNAPIALVVPSDRIPRLSARLGRLADFYKLALRLVAADQAADMYDLFEAGGRAVSSETIVLLSPSVLPFEDGWYGKLLAAHEQEKESVISPTLAYEDHSIRWAGSWLAAPGSDRPLSNRYAGYPVSAVTGLKMTPIAAASLECCIMPRDALFRTGGFSQNYLGAQEKGLDLGLKLNRSGFRSYWLPSVRMLGSDVASSAGDAGLAATLERIDRKMFDACWGSLLAQDEASSTEAAA